MPPWMKRFTASDDPPRPASRVLRELRDAKRYKDSAANPYVHLVDGGVSDNLGMLGVLDALREALRGHGLVPMLFDFEEPSGRDITETMSTLAHLARFVIADLTDPRSIPQELKAVVRHFHRYRWCRCCTRHRTRTRCSRTSAATRRCCRRCATAICRTYCRCLRTR